MSFSQRATTTGSGVLSSVSTKSCVNVSLRGSPLLWKYTSIRHSKLPYPHSVTSYGGLFITAHTVMHYRHLLHLQANHHFQYTNFTCSSFNGNEQKAVFISLGFHCLSLALSLALSFSLPVGLHLTGFSSISEHCKVTTALCQQHTHTNQQVDPQHMC